MRKYRLLVYILGAAVLILSAGCGWASGTPFSGDYADFDPAEYKPAENDEPVVTVQAWFSSMEFLRSANEEGVMVPNKELGRDFELWLSVVNPVLLQDPNGQFIGMEQVEALRELWNDKKWEVEFLDIKLQEASREGEEAKVELTSGGIRYIGKVFFDSPEYRQDSYGDKKGEIFLQFYEDPVNDPLLQFVGVGGYEGLKDIAGRGRWIILGGLDLSEDEPWGEQPAS